MDRSGKHDLSQLRALQDWFLKYELRTVPGVSEVAAVGGMVKQYQIVVDPAKLRAYRLTLPDVRMAVEKGNQESGGAVIELAEAEYMIRVRGYVQGLKTCARSRSASPPPARRSASNRSPRSAWGPRCAAASPS